MSQKVGSKDFELVKNNNIGSSGIELVTKVVQQVPREVWIEGASALLDQLKKHFDNEREGKKKIRDFRTELLYLEIKDLLETIGGTLKKTLTKKELIACLTVLIRKG